MGCRFHMSLKYAYFPRSCDRNKIFWQRQSFRHATVHCRRHIRDPATSPAVWIVWWISTRYNCHRIKHQSWQWKYQCRNTSASTGLDCLFCYRWKRHLSKIQGFECRRYVDFILDHSPYVIFITGIMIIYDCWTQWKYAHETVRCPDTGLARCLLTRLYSKA